MEKSSQKSTHHRSNVYPKLSVEHIKNPNRFYAFPVLGIVVKVIMLIPVFLEIMFLGIAWFFLSIINSFFVLFQAKYWDTFYSINLGLIRLSVKVWFFLMGISDRYPGFEFTLPEELKLDIAMPEHPNRLFAIPFFGGFARFLLLIPYFIYQVVLQNGLRVGVVIASFPVLFAGKYPESIYELGRDYIRIATATTVYLSGLSDSYPSFHISMNHKAIKIALIVVGILLLIGNIMGSFADKQNRSRSRMYRNNYQYQYNSNPSQTY